MNKATTSERIRLLSHVVSQRAFTLMELLLVVAIIGILAAISIPGFNAYIESTRRSRCIAEIRTIEKTILVYEFETGGLPNSLANVSFGALTDPWGSPYAFLRIAGSGMKGKGKVRKDRNMNPLNSDYDLYSIGKDAVSKLPLSNPASFDDIIRANNGGFVGLGRDF